VILHPGYVASSKYNDIALLQLESPVTRETGLMPACLLADYSDLLDDSKFYVTGWGTMNLQSKFWKLPNLKALIS